MKRCPHALHLWDKPHGTWECHEAQCERGRTWWVHRHRARVPDTLAKTEGPFVWLRWWSSNTPDHLVNTPDHIV